jgi:hypothetical protein
MTRIWTDLARRLRRTSLSVTGRALRWCFALLLALMAPLAANANQTVNGITINENLPQARRGVAYSHTVPVLSGGTAPYSFALSGPSTLPLKLTMTSAGLVSGVISCNVGNGNYGQDITVTDSSAVPIVATFSGNKGLAINVTAGPAGTCVTLTIAPASLPALTAGSAYSQTITASGGLGPYTYAVTAGTLPAGLTLNTSTGAITGTPTISGAYSFTITATDAADSTGSMAYSGTVIAPIVVDPSSLPGGTVGSPYSQTVTATGGTGTKTLSLTGSLPAGLTFTSATGLISGTPTTAGTSNFTITATDANSATGSRAYSITVGTPVSVGPASLPAGTVGSAYSQSVTASGGTGPYTYAVTSGPLPAGLSLNTASGAITGTPTASGTSIFSITATDSIGASGLRAYTVTINPAITVSPVSLANGTVGTALSQTVSASGGNGGPYTYSVTGSLPAGLSLNGASGVISGTPSGAGSSSFSIVATDGDGATGSRSYTVTVNAAVVITTPSLPVATVGTPYSQTVAAAGGTGSYTFAVTSGALPAGLSLNGAGLISGTPSTAGSSTVTITATDGNSATGSQSYTLTVNPVLALNPTSLPAGTVGSAYSQSVTASGGTGPYTYAVTSGPLPAGLSLNTASGAITGTPTASGTSIFSITATDSIGASGLRAYSVTINAAIAVNPASLPAGTVGTAYSQAVSATGGTGSYTFSVSAGSLPAGLTLNPGTGAITGTPSASGTSNFTITATDGNSATGSRAYIVTINAAITVNPASLPAGTAGTAYSQSVSATGGTGSYTFSVSAGTLPAGLTLNASTGAITGTPSASGTGNFTITATDGNSATGSRAYIVTINPAITVNPSSLANGTVGIAYSQTVSATGGTGTYTFTVSAGALPAGLTLNSGTGVVSGTPSASGSSSFTITATDGNSATGSRAYSASIAAGINVSPSSLPAATVGVPYSQTISAGGGTGGFTYAVTSGALPAGLALNPSTGALTGTPTSATSATFTVTATDSSSATGSRSYTLTVNPAITVNPASLPAGTVGTAYSQAVSATGGTGSYTFSVSAGSLPAGLTLNAGTGAITGTPSASGTSNFTITATDGNSATGSRAYIVTINPAITVNPVSLPAGTAGTPYSQTITATGGTGAYTYAVTVGALPAGLSLNGSSGAITGTPSASGTSIFTITATDGNSATGSRAYTVTINPGITVNPASLANGTVGVAYSATVTATGGTGSYTFSVTSGALPAGLTLNPATGVLSGTPTTAATSSFTVTATDGASATGSRAYSVTIGAAVAISTVSLPGGTVGAAYNQTIVATGGTGTYTFSVTAGTLPAGLSLAGATGVISGTPTTAATSSFTITATDGNSQSAARAYSVTIAAGVALNPASLPAATVGTPYSQTLSATGGTGSYTFSVSAGALPAGLTLNPATGALTGTPTAAGSSSFTITATDSNSATGSRSYTFSVNAGIAVNPTSLPGAAVGSPYSQSVTASGGTGPYTYSIRVGALPAGLTLNPSTGQISGTPTSAGTSNFTVTATDSASATGSRAFSLVVGTMTVNPATLPAGTVGVPYTQALSTSGGTGSITYSVSAGALPAGLTLNASTGAITGTPTTAAASSFTISAVDSIGVTASRAYSVTIGAALALNPPTLPNPTVGMAYAQTLAATGGSGSYTFSITAGTLPAGLTLNASTGAITGTPTAAGPGTFTVTVTDGAGSSASRAYAVDVAPSTLVLESTTLGNGVVGTPYNQAIVVSGGTAPYAFTLASGLLPAGVTLNASTGALVGTPTTAGTYAFTVRVVDASGASASFAQSIVVEPRPDPSADPTVRGILASQISAASRFGSAQVDNVGARVRMLHLGQDPCSLQFDVSTNVRWERAPGSADDAKPDSAQAAKPDDKSGERPRCDSRFAFWAAGNVDFGFLRPNSATRRSDFTTSGVTVGADTRVLPGLVLGAALGYGRDVADVGTDGSESRAQGASATVYGSYEPLKSLYVDFALGYGGLDFDSTRWNSSSALTGGRSGSQTFGSIGLSTVIDVGGLKFAPYGRFDSVRNRLDAYTESGPVTMALGYADVKATDNALAAGLFASARIPLGGASLEPALRFELRRVRGSSADQSLWYADLPMTTYSITDGTVSDTQLVGGAGLVLRVRDALSVGLDYSYGGSSGVYRNESLRLLLRAPF